MPVVGFHFDKSDVFESVETLVLPKTFRFVFYGINQNFHNLKEIIVDEGNADCTGVDGVLYNHYSLKAILNYFLLLLR